MNEMQFFEGSKNPFNIVKSVAYDLAFMRNNPAFFAPDGIYLFTGEQGSGKSLSMAKCALSLVHEFPAAIVCSNMDIKGIETVPFKHYEQLVEMENGTAGIIFVIDELQVLWNCHESKDIPIEEIGAFSQNRKSRRVILGTSQVYSQVAKSIRQQLKYVIMCHNFMKYIQVNTIVNPHAEGCKGEQDGELDGAIIKRQIFFHSPADYQCYDTYAKIERKKRR